MQKRLHRATSGVAKRMENQRTSTKCVIPRVLVVLNALHPSPPSSAAQPVQLQGSTCIRGMDEKGVNIAGYED